MPAANNPLEALDTVPVESIPAAILRLTARLVATPTREEPADRQLTPQEAAALLRQSVRFVWRNRRALGGVQVSPRKVVFSERRLRRWIDARRAA